MNIEEYEQHGQQRYGAFSQVVRQLLEQAIALEPAYRLQQVQNRAKTVRSLRRRLVENDALGSQEIETLRKDLAGCRIIFYTNNDVNRFAQSGIRSDLFDIDWDRSKFHQPGPGEQSTTGLFQSFNYVVRLKPARTDLVEYRDFAGLACEIQVQTSLNHAWAEMAHDTIYKRSDLEGFGSREMEVIERRLDKAMRDHLLPAGYLFQRIATDAQRIADGKALFDDGLIDAVLNAENNNERDDAVTKLKDDVLPHYDDIQSVFPDVREKLVKAWRIADTTETVPHETPFGQYDGTESDTVTAKIAEIFGRYRYLDIHATYALIRDLYRDTKSEKSRDQLVKLAHELSSNTLQIWEKYGPHVQIELASLISGEEDIASFAPAAIEIAEQILSPEIRGTSSTSTSVTFHTGRVNYSDALVSARRKAVDVIAAHGSLVVDDDDKIRPVLSALLSAGETPRHGTPNIQLDTMIFSDLAYALDQIGGFIGNASKTIRQDFESRLLQQWRWKKTLRKDQEADPEMKSAHADLMKRMLSLRDMLNADEDYVAFKTIVGFKSVFDPMWDDDELDYKRDAALREKLQQDLAETVEPANWPAWRARLTEASNVKSNDLATFPPFSNFLSLVADRQPSLVLDLLIDRTGLPGWTVSPIARILLNSDVADKTRETLAGWIADGRYLAEISACVAYLPAAGKDLIGLAAARAVDQKSQRACEYFVQGAIRNFKEDPAFWRDTIFFPCLSVLKEVRAYNWIEYSHHSGDEHSIFANLTKDQAEALLAAMGGVDQVDYAAEQVLKPILEAYPALVIDWLRDRILRSQTDDPLRFDPIPHAFHDLHKPLQAHVERLIDMLKGLAREDDQHIRWEVSHLLSRVFPFFEAPLADTLSRMTVDASADDLEFIVSVLSGYEGNPKLFPLLREIIASNNCTQAVEDNVSHIVNETGVMTGEFGAAETYKSKIGLLEPWLTNANERVVRFAKSEIQMLERQTAADYRRAQEQIAMRKLEYGEPLEDPQTDNDPDDGGRSEEE